MTAKPRAKTRVTPERRPCVMSRLRCFSSNFQRTERLAQSILAMLNLDACELCISFVSAQRLRELNRSYIKIDKVTDVLSFPQTAWKRALCTGRTGAKQRDLHAPPSSLGDIVISPARAQENAEAIGQPLDREICFLLIHGILHLCGHDHQKAREEAVMIAEQKKILARLASAGAKAPWRGCVAVARAR